MVLGESVVGGNYKKEWCIVRAMDRVADAKAFWLRSGIAVRSIKELALAASMLSDEEFASHASGGGNNFAMWLRDLFGEEELAERVTLCQSKHELQSVLYQYVMQSWQLEEEARRVAWETGPRHQPPSINITKHWLS